MESHAIQMANKHPFDTLGKVPPTQLVESAHQELSFAQTRSHSSPRKHVSRKLKFNLGDTKMQHEKKEFSWLVYRKLLKYTRKQWKLFSVSIFFILVSSFLQSMMPYYIGILLDKISHPDPEGNDELVERTMDVSHLQLLLFISVLAVSIFIRSVVTDVWQERTAIGLRTDVLSSFIGNDIHFFELYKSGELHSRLGNDVNQAKSAISSNIVFLMRSILTVTGNICILMFMSWKLSLFILVLVPVYALVTSMHNRRSKVLMIQYQTVQAESSVHLNQVFTGIQVVKAFSGEQKQISKYHSIQSKGYSINYLKSLYSGVYFTASIFLPNVGILMVLWYGGNLVMSGKTDLTAGELTSFIMYCMTLSREASSISNGYSQIINGTSAVQKVFSMMDYKPLIDERSEGKDSNHQLKGQIQFKEVDFRYPKGDVSILKNLSLHISQGEYVAFVGQSGSGKSTIVKLIERFYEIEGGCLSFDGVDSKLINIHQIRKQIGFVSQEAILFSGTIEQNIVYGSADYSQNDLVEACQKSGCMDFISNPLLFPDGFKTEVGQKGNMLSGGQRQRLSIARALMRKPRILIFDQATSALDSNSEYVVQQSIQRLVSIKDNQMTIIVIAHRLSTIINAQKICVMKEGRIVETGNHQQLLQEDGYYSSLFSKQIQKGSSSRIETSLHEVNESS